MSSSYLVVKNLFKSFGNKTALKNINLNLNAGEKVALLGCNGAGKSTLINIITGLKFKTSGDVILFDQPSSHFSAKQKLAYLPQTLKFPGFLKVKDIITLVEGHFKSQLPLSILKRLDLDTLLNRYCHGLSGGEERKLAMALCFIGDRPFFILDEPTANVDLIAKNEIHCLLQEHTQLSKKAILFSSHEMSEVEKLADRVIVLNSGQVVAEGRVRDIKQSFGLAKVTFKSESKSLHLKSSSKIEIISSEDNLTEFVVYGPNSDNIISELVQNTISFHHLSIEQTSLDEVFLKIWSPKP